MDDNQNIELETANLDNQEVKQPETWDISEAKWNEQEEQTVDLSWLNSKTESAKPKDDNKQKVKEWIINSYVQKVATWDVELDDVPEWAKWDVNSQLSSIVAPKETTNSFSKEDVVAQAKAELKFESKLESLAWKYTKEEADLITAQFQSLKEANPRMDRSEVLDYSIFKLWLWKNNATPKIKNAPLPPQWQAPVSKWVYTEEQLMNMDQAQYEKIKKMANNWEVTIK